MELFKRKLYHKIVSQINDKEFVIIAGARQTGKTTILKQLAGYFEDQQIKYSDLTLEDFSILTKLNEHPENIFSFVPKPQKNEKLFVLIDEIQYLKDPTNFLKLLYDKYSPDLKIIATGSSAFYIDLKFKDSLAGRKQLYELGTLDFEEFLLFKTGDNKLELELNEIRTNSGYISARRREIQGYFTEYLTFGSYPSVVLASTAEKKTTILRELLNSYVKRDISEANIQYPDKFFYLMQILAEQTGNLLNVNELSQTLGLSVTSINAYILILQKCFHIRLLKPFYRNLRKELTKMPKIYFSDSGLRNILLNQFFQVDQRFDKGALLENYLFLRLTRLYSADNLRYWRTTNQKEIDFIVLHGLDNGFAIECKFQAVNFDIEQYKQFLEAYPKFPLHCRSYYSEKNEEWVLAI
ncbi:MAG: ATP-binding protein [Bacteroidales bacterium]